MINCAYLTVIWTPRSNNNLTNVNVLLLHQVGILFGRRKRGTTGRTRPPLSNQQGQKILPPTHFYNFKKNWKIWKERKRDLSIMSDLFSFQRFFENKISLLHGHEVLPVILICSEIMSGNPRSCGLRGPKLAPRSLAARTGVC